MPSPPAAEPPPSLPPCDDALVKRVAAGAAPFGELLTHLCIEADMAHATMAARMTPRLTGFVTARRRGTAVASSPDGHSTRVSWRGTCLARIAEALPSSDGARPSECLHDAEVTEQQLPPDLGDMRAEFLLGDAAMLRRWRFCRKQSPAETCLDRLLPLTGGGLDRDGGRASWIKVRDHIRKGVGVVRRARCRLALVDHAEGILAFRCRGTLIDAACRGDDSVTFSGGSGSCADGEMAMVGHVDAAPLEACLQSARTALRVPPERFAVARVAALAACAPGIRMNGGAGGDVDRPAPLGDQELDPAPRALIHRVLARQQALFGPVTLAPRCTQGDGTCVSVPDGGFLGRVIARGCGNQIWALQMTSNLGTIGNGGWGGYDDDRQLVRLPAATKLREPAGSPVYIVDSFAWGNLFKGYQIDRGRGDETHTEAELIEEACIAKQGNPDLCSAYARGRPTSRAATAPSDDDRNRVEALIASDWPRASRRLARWQLELANGARLNVADGEEQRQTCTRLLIDACTGDLGEVCTLRQADDDDTSCDGELLPDGRCRLYHFVRLPLLLAQPPAR